MAEEMTPASVLRWIREESADWAKSDEAPLRWWASLHLDRVVVNGSEVVVEAHEWNGREVCWHWSGKHLEPEQWIHLPADLKGNLWDKNSLYIDGIPACEITEWPGYTDL